MDFKERVFNAFRNRIKSGQNVESAIMFRDADFPGATREEISSFKNGIYAEKQIRGFILTQVGIDEALEDLD